MPQTAQPKPLTTEQVIGRLLESAGGQIIACNVVAGIQNGLVDPAWAADVLAWMGTLASHEHHADPKRFLRALDDLKMRRHPTASLPPDLPDIRLCGVDAPVPFEVEVSCILPAWMLRMLIFGEDKQRLRREGLALPRSPADHLAPAVAEEWRSKPAHVRTVRVNRASTVGRHHSVVWFTRRTALADALAAVAPSARAQRTRDLLGLVQHQEGAMLAAMHFQPPTLSACPSARPTFADAGCHTRFKAWPDDEAARQERRWGWTVDLDALSASAMSVDGCPERIAKSIDGDSLSDGAAFEFELLGTVQAPAAQGDAADAPFARRLLNGRTVPELGAELKTLTGPH